MLVHNTAYCETILQNDRLILRPLLIGDATAISCIRSDEQVNKYIDRASQLSEVGAKDFILKIQKGYEIRQWFYWAIFLKSELQIVGTICLFHIDEIENTAELGYELSSNYHRCGIIKEAMKEVLKFAKSISISKLYAYTKPDNIASVKLLEVFQFSIDELKIDANQRNVVFSKNLH